MSIARSRLRKNVESRGISRHPHRAPELSMESTLLPKPNEASLEKLFPPLRISTEEIGGIAPELFDYRRDFGNRTWLEIDEDTYRTHTDAFCLMDHETLRHFIAGFMRVSISEEKLLDQHSLIYFAASNKFCDFCRLLTHDQLLCLLGFIDYILTNDWYSGEEQIRYLENREKLLRTLLDRTDAAG
jgi:hypothetical protein